MSENPHYNKSGGYLPRGTTLVTATPDEHIMKFDPPNAWLCVRAEHKNNGHECTEWGHQAGTPRT